MQSFKSELHAITQQLQWLIITVQSEYNLYQHNLSNHGDTLTYPFDQYVTLISDPWPINLFSEGNMYDCLHSLTNQNSVQWYQNILTIIITHNYKP